VSGARRRYVVLLSGLDLGGKGSDPMLVQLMVDTITGQLGNKEQQRQMAAVVRVIIVGNSLSSDTRDLDAASKVCVYIQYY
jgi:hypothetical protein